MMEWVLKVEGAQKRIGQIPEGKILCLVHREPESQITWSLEEGA